MSSTTFDPLAQPLLGAYAVEASAGTGKTYSITLLWLRLLIEEGLRVDQILVTTFTTAATGELQGRLLAALRRALAAAEASTDGAATGPEAAIVASMQGRLGVRDLVQELEAAVSCFDLAPIVTIHGFCRALISRNILELAADPDAELLPDAQAVITGVMQDHLLRHAAQDAPSVHDAARVASVVASNPLGRLLDPVQEPAVRARQEELIDSLAAQVVALRLSSRTSEAILKQLQARRLKLSPAQVTALGGLVSEFEAAVHEAAALDQALEAARLHPCAVQVHTQVPVRLRRAGMRTFDDILLTVHQAVDEGGSTPLAQAVRQRFAAAIIDECQDTDGVQIDVFRRLFLRRNPAHGLEPAPGIRSFIVIGDPKQSIYRFRGADLGSYRQLAGGVRPTLPMTVNYRSDWPLVEAINRFYTAHPDFSDGSGSQPIRYEQVTAKAPGSRLFDSGSALPLRILWSAERERASAKRDLARQTAAEFQRILASQVDIIDRESGERRRVTASDLAVLAHQHPDLRLVRQELQTLGIPCQMAGKSLGRIWHSDEARDVLAWLAAMQALEQRNDPLAAVLACAATPLGGLDAPGLLALRDDPTGQARWIHGVQRDLEDLRIQGPLPLLLRRMADPDRVATHLQYRDGERRMTNWRQVGSLLQVVWTSGRHRPADLVRWLSRALVGQGGDDEAGDGDLVKLETDLPAVQLVTLHAAKGLEYPVVACPFLWQVKSRQYRSQAPLAVLRTTQGTVLDVGSKDFSAHLQRAVTQEDEEQERLAYVALTRARHRLILGMAAIAGSGKHDNGAERSAIATVLGVAAQPLDAWRDALAPWIEQLTAVQRNDTDDVAKLDLTPPPTPTRTCWPIRRCASYTALSSASLPDDDLWARDHGAGQEGARGVEGLLSGLGGGTTLGNQVHAALEEVLGNRSRLAAAMDARDERFANALQAILDCCLQLGSEGPQVSLAGLTGTVIAEMHFLLPVASITAGSLAQALLPDPAISGEAEARTWAERLTRWTIKELQGFLQGYIDLVFTVGERWYLADYKTNRLPSYEPPALDAAMRQEDYLLQAWIYALALHRHLRAHLPDYTYEHHFGGCAYLFVRGFPDQGVWFRRPALATLERLDALLAPAEVNQ